MALDVLDLAAAAGGCDPLALPPQPWAIEALRCAIDRHQGRSPAACRAHSSRFPGVQLRIQALSAARQKALHERIDRHFRDEIDPALAIELGPTTDAQLVSDTS